LQFQVVFLIFIWSLTVTMWIINGYPSFV
jgi:hypothetical protein